MQTATLEVVIPPDIINEETSGDMMVPEGGSAKLVCRARGHPKPRIIWRREDGRDIIARNGSHSKNKGKREGDGTKMRECDRIMSISACSTFRRGRNANAVKSHAIGNGRLHVHRLQWGPPNGEQAHEATGAL